MRGVLVVLLSAAPVWADPVPHREGAYGGVLPGEVQPREPAGKPAKAKRPPSRGTLTWVGYASRSAEAEVFFQSVAPFEVSQRVEGGAVVVHLGLTRLGHNTWRQVDTRFFEGPLAGVIARAVGAARATKDRPARSAGIEARITFKNPQEAREATVRTATEADGMYYVYLTFPTGGAPAAPPESPSAPDHGEPAHEPPATPAPAER